MLDLLIEYSRMLMWRLSNLVSDVVSGFEIEVERGWDGFVHVLKLGVDSKFLIIENTCYGDLNRYVNCKSFNIKLITDNGDEVKLDEDIVEKDNQVKEIVSNGINKIRIVNEIVDKLSEIPSKLVDKENPSEVLEQITTFLVSGSVGISMKEVEELKQKLSESENTIKQFEEEIKQLRNRIEELEKEVNELRKYREFKERIETFVKQLNINELNQIINEYKDRLKKPTFIKAIGGNTVAQKLSKIVNTLEELLKQLSTN